MFSWKEVSVATDGDDGEEGIFSHVEAVSQDIGFDAVEAESAAASELTAALFEHRLLSSAEEYETGMQLSEAFVRLTQALTRDVGRLGAVIRHVTEVLWPMVESEAGALVAQYDRVVTGYDQWLVAYHLARSDIAWEPEADQQLAMLRDVLADVSFPREWLLEVARACAADEAAGLAERKALRHGLAMIDRLRNRLVSHNLRLVHHIAQQFANRGVDFEDLVQEGILGLYRATLKFDPMAGARFSTYAYWWIMQAIRNAIVRDRSLIRYPNSIGQQISKLYAFRLEYRAVHGRWPDKKTAARATGIPSGKIQGLLALVNVCVSANTPLYDDSDDTLEEKLSYDDVIPPPHAVVEADDPRREIEALLSLLPEREATILRLKFGIGRDDGMSCNQIAPHFQLSGERVRQLEKTALSALKQATLGGGHGYVSTRDSSV